MNKERAPGTPSKPTITVERALEVLTAELSEERRERGRWNEEAGDGVTPDEFEQAIVLAIRAIRQGYGKP